MSRISRLVLSASAFLLAIAFVASVTPPEFCLVVVGGHTYDLSALVRQMGQPNWEITSGLNTYMFNICGGLSGDSCDGGRDSCYQAKTGPPLSGCTSLGNYDMSVDWELLDIGDPSQGLVLTIGGGDSTAPCVNRPRKTIFNFPNIPGAPISASEQLPPGCQWIITFPTIYSCLDAPPPPKGNFGGWAFVIIYLVGFFLYFVIGYIVKMQRGAVGMERIPNIDFWQQLPTLVKEGLLFAVNKVKSCCGGGSSSSHEQLA